MRWQPRSPASPRMWPGASRFPYPERGDRTHGCRDDHDWQPAVAKKVPSDRAARTATSTPRRSRSPRVHSPAGGTAVPARIVHERRIRSRSASANDDPILARRRGEARHEHHGRARRHRAGQRRGGEAHTVTGDELRSSTVPGGAVSGSPPRGTSAASSGRHTMRSGSHGFARTVLERRAVDACDTQPGGAAPQLGPCLSPLTPVLPAGMHIQPYPRPSPLPSVFAPAEPIAASSASSASATKRAAAGGRVRLTITRSWRPFIGGTTGGWAVESTHCCAGNATALVRTPVPSTTARRAPPSACGRLGNPQCPVERVAMGTRRRGRRG